MTWTMSDGTQIEIKEMTTSHIINALELMRRKMIALGKELADRTGNKEYSEAEVERVFKDVVYKNLQSLKSDMKH